MGLEATVGEVAPCWKGDGVDLVVFSWEGGEWCWRGLARPFGGVRFVQ